MIGRTHAAVGAASAWCVYHFYHLEPHLILPVIASLFALLPDIDASDAKIKHLGYKGIKPLAPISFLASGLFKHRGFFHSLLFGFLLYLLGWYFFAQNTFPSSYIIAALFGFYSHLLLDSLTKSGIYFLWPLNKTFHLLPKAITVKTGGLFDEILWITGSMATLLYYIYFFT